MRINAVQKGFMPAGIKPGVNNSPRISPSNPRRVSISILDSVRQKSTTPMREEESSSEQSCNFNSNISSFFQAHRPVKLVPGERVIVLRRATTTHQQNRQESPCFSFGPLAPPTSSTSSTSSTTSTTPPRFQFTAGIIEQVEERLCCGDILEPVRKGKFMKISCRLRCERGNRIFIDRVQNNEAILSGCKSFNDGMIEIKWLSKDEDMFECRAQADVDLNKAEILALLESNGSPDMDALRSMEVGDVRLRLHEMLESKKKKSDSESENENERDASPPEEVDDEDGDQAGTKDGKKGRARAPKNKPTNKRHRRKGKKNNGNDDDDGFDYGRFDKELVVRAGDVRQVRELTPRAIRVLLFDENAVTVAYDDDHSSRSSSRARPRKMYEEDYQSTLEEPHIHHRSEVVPIPMPSTSLGEKAAQFLHRNGGDDDDEGDLITAQYREGFPTYGRILLQRALTIVTGCEAAAHMNRNTGLTAAQMGRVARELRLTELREACGLRRDGTAAATTRMAQVERVEQYALDCMALLTMARERGGEQAGGNGGGGGGGGGIGTNDLLFNVWAEYPLSLLKQHPGGGGSASNGGNGGNGGDALDSSLLGVSLLGLRRIYDTLYGVSSSIWSMFNCYRRESSSPLWQDRLQDHVPRPVRVAPAGAHIRCTSWHPLRHRMAIAASDGSVFVHIPQLDDEEDGYDEDVSGWLPFKLKHQFQRNITCMEWQPLSGTGLAVGCQSGICFWRLTSPSDTSDQNNPKNQKNAWCEFFCADNQQHAPINALSWSPNGRLLASGSVSSDHILIWDVATGMCTPLLAVASCGVTLIKWSPSGHYVFAATLSKVVRVWETKTWTGERWTIPTGPCQSACWNPQGTLLLAAVAGCSDMWTFAFHHTPPDIFGVLADLRLDVGHIWGEHMSDSEDDDEGERKTQRGGGSGGGGAETTASKHRFCIREVAWSKDPFGQRLAVTVNVRGSHLKKGSGGGGGRRRGRSTQKRGKQGGGKKSRKSKSPRNKNRKKKNKAQQEQEGEPVTKNNQTRQQQPPVGEDEREGEQVGTGSAATVATAAETAAERPDSDMVTLRDGEELILIYSVQIQPSLRFTPRGFLRGPKDGIKPYNIDFWKACDTGALLSACWLNGEVTLYPLLYEVKRQQYNGASLMGRDEEDINTTLDEYDDDHAMTLERRDVYNQSSSYRVDW